MRTGGFGGAAGLRTYLDAEGVDAVVDATHPYAANISRHAARACDVLGVRRVQLRRPAWTPVDGDRWVEAASFGAAAEAVANAPVSEAGCVFLSTGARDLRVFGRLSAIRFLVRLVDVPRTPLPLGRFEVIVGRGPFAVGPERTLFLDHGVELLVSRNSGGGATYPKLVAARELRIPVIMIKRPDPETGPRVETAEEAFRWLIEDVGPILAKSPTWNP